jgi:hypothetical protein
MRSVALGFDATIASGLGPASKVSGILERLNNGEAVDMCDIARELKPFMPS